jgi:hypothetical protein
MEPEDLQLKKYEELYNLTKTELEKGHSRFAAVEEKANRQFSLLVVLLGFVSIGAPEYASIVKSHATCWRRFFTYLYPLLAINVLVSIFFYMRAISFARYKNIILDKEMFDHFKANRYVDVIYSLSKRYAGDLRIMNAAIERKVNRAAVAFWFTHASLVLIVFTIIVYIIIKLQ